MKNKVIWFLVLLAIAVGVLVWQRPPVEEAKDKKKSSPPVPVTVAKAVSQDWPVTLEAIGRGEASETVTLKSRVDGQVLSVAFAEGKPVAAGATLLRLDPSDFQARVRQAEAMMARDQALLDKARADVLRYQSLLDQQFVSQEKVAEVRAIAAAAAATVQADQAVLDLARQQLSYTTIRAPFAGVVGARLVHPGASIKLNDTELAVINRIQPLYVSFTVPEKHLAAVHAARKAGLKEGIHVDISLPGEVQPMTSGKVVFLDHAVDPATATLRMKAEIANANGGISPGQFLNIRLRLQTLQDVVTLPAEAVQQGPEGSFVYVVNEDGSTKIRKVELIQTNTQTQGGRIALSKGVSAGETVVTDGYSRLTPGSKVKIKTPGAKEASSSPPRADLGRD